MICFTPRDGNDILICTLGFEELAEAWEAQQDPRVKTIIKSFVEGLNAYAKAHPEAIDKENKIVLPITTKDVNMHSMFVVFTRFIASGELELSQQWGSMGSNAYAVGPSRSASGNAMLVQNPHLPWFNEFLFFESHLTPFNAQRQGYVWRYACGIAGHIHRL